MPFSDEFSDEHRDSLTKADLAEKLYEELGYNKREAKAVSYTHLTLPTILRV